MILLSEQTENKQERRESVRLDETVKLLFEVSKELLVKTLNSLFHENYDVDRVEIEKTATEYPTNDLSILRADIFIKITEHKPYHFHIEIETEPSHEIAVRVFEYDIMKAISNWRLDGKTTSEPEIFMPKSIVIHIEGGSRVPQEHHRVKLIMADGNIVNYTVPVMRYWEYDKSRLIQENLYTLLPLQVFMLRDELDRMTARGDEEARQAAILKARDIATNIINEIINIYKGGKISFYDVDKIMLAVKELFTHLNKRYSVNEKLNTEVDIMVRTLYDENVVNQAKIEIAKKLLEKGLSVEDIADSTELDPDIIEELKEQFEKNKR